MRTFAIILFICTIAGCAKNVPPSDFTNASSVANARVQSDLAGADYAWKNLERFVKSKGVQLWRSLGFHIDNAKLHSDAVDIQLVLAGGQARKNWEDLQESRSIRKRLEEDFWSYRQRKYAARIIGWTLGIYAGLGALSVAFGLFGLMGWSKLLTMNLPFMGPFVKLRDWLIRRKQAASGATTSMNINIAAPPSDVSIEAPPQTEVTRPSTPTRKKRKRS